MTRPPDRVVVRYGDPDAGLLRDLAAWWEHAQEDRYINGNVPVPDALRRIAHRIDKLAPELWWAEAAR